MVTVSQLYAELRAREKKLTEAVSAGWRDAIPSAQECVAEMRHEVVEKLLSPDNAQRIIMVGGELDMGPLGTGLSLAYSGGTEWAR